MKLTLLLTNQNIFPDLLWLGVFSNDFHYLQQNSLEGLLDKVQNNLPSAKKVSWLRYAQAYSPASISKAMLIKKKRASEFSKSAGTHRSLKTYGTTELFLNAT